MVYGCQCAARKAVSGNTLHLVGYTSTKANLLSKRQEEAALGLGGQEVKGWRRPQRTGQTRDRSQDTSATQHQFQETGHSAQGSESVLMYHQERVTPPGTEEHQASSGQGREEEKLRQRLLSSVEGCAILLVPHVQSLYFIIMGNWARSHPHMPRRIRNGDLQGRYSINLKVLSLNCSP